MTREEAARIITVILDCCKGKEPDGYEEREIIPLEKSFEALNMAIEILQQEPCEDAVNRQAVLDKVYAYGNGLEPEGYCVEVEDIQALPPVTPAQKKGKWIDDDPVNHKYHRCSCCGTGDFNWGADNYCRNCGARMEIKQ